MIQFPHLHIAASRIITFTYTYLRSRNGNTLNKTNLNSLQLSPYIHTVLQSRFESQFRVESQLGSNVPPSSVNFRIRHLPTFHCSSTLYSFPSPLLPRVSSRGGKQRVDCARPAQKLRNNADRRVEEGEGSVDNESADPRHFAIRSRVTG